ncbi:hypothetical protein AB9P05_01905 [Roseivirga sp. BDSF3-8]
MKKKLQLKELQLQSFIISSDKKITGGGPAPYTYRKNCDPETLIPLCVDI